MVLLIDPQIAGISGDMFLSALVDIGANKSKIINGIQIAENFLTDTKINKLDFEKVKKHGTESTRLLIEFSEKNHERKGTEIKDCVRLCIEKIGLTEKAQKYSLNSIDKLINAEAKVHGISPDSVHFHEASSIDTVVDIVGTAMALEDLHYFDDEIITAPVAVGGGTLNFSHGTTSNPAGAILEIFRNSSIIISGGMVKDELTTPTGAALLASLTNNCSEYYPQMKIKSIGYGAGKKDFDGFSNVLKIVQGEKNYSYANDSVTILETNIDDVSGEVLGNMIERIITAGAKDVTISPALSKKGRPSNLVSVICDSDLTNEILDLLFSETRTLGIRIRTSKRYILPRTIETVPVIIDNQNFNVRCKVARKQDKIINLKIESDDVKKIANSLKQSYIKTEELTKELVKKKLMSK